MVVYQANEILPVVGQPISFLCYLGKSDSPLHATFVLPVHPEITPSLGLSALWYLKLVRSSVKEAWPSLPSFGPCFPPYTLLRSASPMCIKSLDMVRQTFVVVLPWFGLCLSLRVHQTSCYFGRRKVSAWEFCQLAPLCSRQNYAWKCSNAQLQPGTSQQNYDAVGKLWGVPHTTRMLMSLSLPFIPERT